MAHSKRRATAESAVKRQLRTPQYRQRIVESDKRYQRRKRPTRDEMGVAA